jgi:hypothetical protein
MLKIIYNYIKVLQLSYYVGIEKFSTWSIFKNNQACKLWNYLLCSKYNSATIEDFKRFILTCYNWNLISHRINKTLLRNITEFKYSLKMFSIGLSCSVWKLYEFLSFWWDCCELKSIGRHKSENRGWWLKWASWLSEWAQILNENYNFVDGKTTNYSEIFTTNLTHQALLLF